MSSYYKFFASLFFTLFALQAVAQQAEELSEEERQQRIAEYQQWATEFEASLTKQTGTIQLPGGNATLNLGEQFYYLSPADAKRVLEEGWGNPPGWEVLGMIFPAGRTTMDDDTWGVTIEFVADGYVSDDDAADIDYSDLLADMQEDTANESAERVQQGYETIELIGWAQPPVYDAANKRLHWAKEIKFGEAEENTLNYNIRILGRKGFLVLNYIAGMHQIGEINGNIDTLMASVNYDQGFTYDDFNPDVDQVAAYGLGALVAGKVLAKTGFLAVAILLLKKFWFVIAAAVIGAFRFITGKKKSEN